MKKNILSAIASSFAASMILFLSSCAAEDPKSVAPTGNSSDMTGCNAKNQILNSSGRCEPCAAGQQVRGNQCRNPLSASELQLQTACVNRGATFDEDTMQCAENTSSCLRAEPVGRKVFSESLRACVDRLKSAQICAPQGYNDQTDQCTENEEYCRNIRGMGFVNGVCSGTPTLNAQQLQQQTNCINQGLEFNAATNSCRANAAYCQQRNQQFDANSGQCVQPSIWGQILPGIIGIIPQLIR